VPRRADSASMWAITRMSSVLRHFAVRNPDWSIIATRGLKARDLVECESTT
jgi:hypothetical protein